MTKHWYLISDNILTGIVMVPTKARQAVVYQTFYKDMSKARFVQVQNSM